MVSNMGSWGGGEGGKAKHIGDQGVGWRGCKFLAGWLEVV